jgi:methylmalonyl-CoA epimerase
MTGVREEMKIDHLGIAVKSIAKARKFYEALGLEVAHEETVAHERVHTAMLPIGESRVELLQATDEQSTVAKFIAKRGEGLHHIALLTPDIHAAMRELKQRGVRLVNDAIQRGAGGHEYFFVHPSSAGGVLVELVQAADHAEHL